MAIPLPKEHGAWAVLYAPLVVAAATAGAVDLRLPLFLVAVTALFLAHEPFSRLARLRSPGSSREKSRHWLRWLLIYLGMAAGATLPLLLVYRLWHLLFFGLAAGTILLVHIVLTARRAERHLVGEFLAVAGLTLGAPGVHYAMTGSLDFMALRLWALHTLFFTSGIFFVKMRVARYTERPGQRSLLLQCAAYHAGLAVVVTLWAWAGDIPVLAAATFAPIVVRAFWGMRAPRGRLSLRRIGFKEVGFTALFVVTLVWALQG